MEELANKRCVPCEGGTPKLPPARVAELLRQLPGWEASAERLTRSFTFKDFRMAMAFVNRMAELAEAEGHHPDFTVHYSKVTVYLWTHAIGGLSENDFIVAAKLSRLA
ncbi:MAG: 4a-hydroxytetrahydrobiopterin dehydratase [Deltaproteobacteria bacterium]